MIKKCVCEMLVLWMLSVVGSCGLEEAPPEKIRDLEFTVVEESQIPEEFSDSIEKNKEEGFKMIFDTEEARYIGVGYGVQDTEGYSISVDQLYLTENAIYISTTLIGPSKGEPVMDIESCPYLVVRTERSDKSVVFE